MYTHMYIFPATNLPSRFFLIIDLLVNRKFFLAVAKVMQKDSEKNMSIKKLWK